MPSGFGMDDTRLKSLHTGVSQSEEHIKNLRSKSGSTCSSAKDTAQSI